MRRCLRGLVVLCCALGWPGDVDVIAGDLKPPPGPVTPTMKPLTEIEPRIAVSAANTPGDAAALFVISQPGSYYLTGPVTGEPGKDGIAIAAGLVTLDLNGFDLTGIKQAQHGVHVRGPQRAIVVRNGSARGWPGIGIDVSEAPASRVEDVRVTANGVGIVSGNRCTVHRSLAEDNDGGGILTGQGCAVTECTSSFNRRYGIYVLESSRVTDCTVEGNTNHGLYLDGDGCTVAGCQAVSNMLHGIASIYSATIEHTTAEHNGGDGLWSLGPVTFVECRTSFNAGDGLDAGSGSSVTRCIVRGNGQDGLRIGSHVVVAGSQAFDQRKGAGVRVTGDSCRIEGNAVTGNAIGVSVEGRNNLAVRNTASANASAAFEIGPGNSYGPIISAVGAGDLSGVAGAEHPLANLIH